MWSLNLVTPPAAEPLDLETEVKPHLRVTGAEAADQAAGISGATVAAREACEGFTGRQLITATWELWLQEWCEPGITRDGAIRIPKPPLQQQAGSPALTAGVLSVKYLDTAGAEQTLAADQYQILAPVGPTAQRGLIFPAYGVAWPSVRCQPAAIKIRYTAGYGATFASVPGSLRAGMKLQVSEANERRELATIGTIQSKNELTAERLWWPYRSF